MTTKVTYSIPNIHCEHCVHTIQSELIDMAGVKSVKASQQLRNATIEFDAPATEDGIKALLSEINYPAEG
jgi:copper chaperone